MVEETKTMKVPKTSRSLVSFFAGLLLAGLGQAAPVKVAPPVRNQVPTTLGESTPPPSQAEKIFAQPIGEPVAADKIAKDVEASGTARLVNFHTAARIEGQFIVYFKNDAGLKDVASKGLKPAASALPSVLPTTDVASESLARALVIARNGSYEGSLGADLFGRRGFWTKLSEGQARLLASDPRIDYIEPVTTTYASSTQNLPADNSIWHLDRLDQQRPPLDRKFNFFSTGIRVRIWLLDTGVAYMHNDFGGRAGNGVRDCTVADCNAVLTGNEYVGYASSPSQADCFGHGTHVASAAIGSTFGVAKNAEIVGVKVFDGCDNAGTSAHLIQGINFVRQNRNLGAYDANIVNFSGSAGAPTAAVTNAFNALLNDNVSVVVATPDSASIACQSAPANLEDSTNVIVVSWSTNADTRALDSAYGNCVTLFAPGQDIMTADTGPIPCDPINFPGNNAICKVSGSSVAAPQVTGIAALYLEKYPQANPGQVKTAVVWAASSGVLSGNLGCANPPSGGCSPNLLASSWVLGNSAPGTTVPPGGGGVPPPQVPLPISAILNIILSL
jgi:hypothetical protein